MYAFRKAARVALVAMIGISQRPFDISNKFDRKGLKMSRRTIELSGLFLREPLMKNLYGCRKMATNFLYIFEKKVQENAIFTCLLPLLPFPVSHICQCLCRRTFHSVSKCTYMCSVCCAIDKSKVRENQKKRK